MLRVNFDEYTEQRNALVVEAEGLIAEDKIEESNAKMKEVEDLDNKWEEIKLANANLNALKDNTKVTDITNQSEPVEGGIILDNILEPTNVVDESKIYENAWANYMQGNRLEGRNLEVFNKVNKEYNNAFTHTTINTPTLIPQTVVDGIWARAEEMYPFLADTKKYNVTGKLIINTHDSISAGDATWYDEATSTVDEKNAFGQLILDGCELAKAITVSWKMRAMAIEAFIPYITRELGTRVGVALGKSVLQGKGKPGQNDTFKPEPLGVEVALAAEDNTPQVVTYNPDATPAVPLTYDKVVEAIGKVHSSYLNGSAFYANNATIWNVLATIKDGEQRPIFIPDTTAGGVGRMLGFVVKADAGVTANNLVFGNPGEAYIVNTNEPMSVATEEHVKARTVDYAAYTIVDGAPLDLKAFALIKKSS